MAEPGAVIDGTAIEDLKGWPISHSFDLPARDDADAIRITKDWYPGMSSYLNSIHRYMVGEPRLLKTVTIDWKTWRPISRPAPPRVGLFIVKLSEANLIYKSKFGNILRYVGNNITNELRGNA